MNYQELIEIISRAIELLGIIIIIYGAVSSSVIYVLAWIRADDISNSFKAYRQNLGRSILLGLEFLLAGDIIRSVAVQPSFTSVGILAIIVIIRSFLAVELEMEIEGKWPWQQTKEHHKHE